MMRNRTKRTVRLFAVAAVVLACWAPAAQAATPGDSRAEALPLAGSLPLEVSASNVGATADPGEAVDIFGAGHSVWFKWEAPVAGWISIGACNSDFAAVIGIFEVNGSGGLTRVVERMKTNEGPSCQFAGRQLTFRATACKEYVIGVDGNGFSPPMAPKPTTEGTFALRIEATPPPVNDDFANAVPVAGRITEEPNGARIYLAPVNGYNWGASKQVGEPDHGGDPGGASVWYSWTAPENGQTWVMAGPESGSAFVAVYTGSALGSLVPISSDRSSGTAYLRASAGTTYLIAVDSRRNTETGETPELSFNFRVSMMLAPGPGEPKQDQQPQGLASPPPAPLPAPVPPQTILGKRTVQPDKRAATFRFASSVAGSRFRCKLDRGRFAPCRSPKTYRHLAAGRHAFKAVAVDATGLADPTPLVAHLWIPKR